MEENNDDGKRSIDISKIIENYKKSIELVQVNINGKEVKLPIYYNVKAYSIYMKVINSTDNYKKAFCVMLCNMVNDNRKIKNNESQVFKLDDIENLSDDDLHKVIEVIIQNSEYYQEIDHSLNNQFNDIYEEFYLINKKQSEKINNTINKLGSSFSKQVSNVLESNNYIYSELKQIVSLTNKINIPKFNPNTFINIESIVSEIAATGRVVQPILESNISKINQSAVNMSKVYDIYINSSINSLRLQVKPVIDRLMIINPQIIKISSEFSQIRDSISSYNLDYLKEILLKERDVNKIFQNHLYSFGEVLKPLTYFSYQGKTVSLLSIYEEINNKISPLLMNIDTVLLSRVSIKGILEKKAETMLKFGWWFISSLTLNIINYIYNNKDTLSKEDVDALICKYYKENNYKELNEICNRWRSLDCYKRRIEEINEAFYAHKKQKYSLSVSVWTNLIEGSIRDFMQETYHISYYKFEPVYNNFKAKIIEIDKFVVNYVIDCIDAFYVSFNPTEPDKIQDFSRNKIAHGLAINYGTEVNSLKLILYLDELFYVMCGLKGIDVA